jgi:predicted RNase H-like HicB family nuclease
MQRKFTIIIREGDEWKYTAQCLEIPQARSEGNTKEEAIKNVREAIELILEHMEDSIKKDKGVVEVNI